MAKKALAKKRQVMLAVTLVRFFRNPAGTSGAAARCSCQTKQARRNIPAASGTTTDTEPQEFVPAAMNP